MVEICQLKPSQISTVREMMKEYLAWAFSLDEDSLEAPTFRGVDDELRELPGIFAPPQGRLLVAEKDGRACGCVALKRIDSETCELKRLYVRPEARGQKVGAQLVDQLTTEAKESGYRKMILDSHHSMTAAHAIYRQAGFCDVAPYVGFPLELVSKVVFMEKLL
jgi:ribosomal protein S18 acetylase RimI-like enzyme